MFKRNKTEGVEEVVVDLNDNLDDDTSLEVAQAEEESETLDGWGLPGGFFDARDEKFYRGYEIKALTADVLAQIHKESANKFRLFGALVAHGLTRIYDTATGEDLPNWKSKTSRLFFVDVFYLMIEIIIKTTGSSLISTVYKCPQCGGFTKFENSPERGGTEESGFDLGESDDVLTSLDQEDIRDLPFYRFEGDKPLIKFNLKGVQLDDTQYTDYHFTLPLIEDYINESGKGGAAGEANLERRVLLKCLTRLNGIEGKDLVKLKNKYGLNLLRLELPDYFTVLNRLDKLGYDYKNHSVVCSKCNYEFKAVFDLTNFFASVLGTQS